MSTPDIRKGDKVRLTVEGVVKEIRGRDPIFQLDNGVNYATGQYRVEILERAKPKVGDEVAGSELHRLPYGTVVARAPGGFAIPALIGPNGITYPDKSGGLFSEYAQFGDTFEILYIPIPD